MVYRKLILLTALAAHVGAPCAAGFDGRYVSKVGDLDGDGRQDIFIEYRPRVALIDLDGLAIPVPTTKAPTAEFVLKGNSSGSFDLATSLTATQKSAARGWQRAQLPLVRGDYNADGLVDVRVKAVSSVIPGAIDPLVFAASGTGAAATAVKSLDAQTMHFVNDLSGWVDDPAYYQSGWHVVAITEYDGFAWPTYNCNGTLYPDISILNPGPPDPIFGVPTGSGGSLPNNGEGCVYVGDYGWNDVIVTTWAFDPSSFHARAMSVARTLQNYRHGDNQFTLSTADKNAIKQEFAQALGITVGASGEITIPVPPPELDWPWLRWISRVNPLILLAMIINIAIPNSTADDDTFNFFHHYGFMQFAASIAASGLFPPVFLTQGPIMTGQQAHSNLNLSGAIRDAVYFVQLPKSWPLTGPRPVAGGGEGWLEWISAQTVPPIYVSPPRALPASGP